MLVSCCFPILLTLRPPRAAFPVFTCFRRGAYPFCPCYIQVDQKFNKMVLDSIQGTLPVRVGSMNMCYAPSFFRVIWMVISTFLHE